MSRTQQPQEPQQAGTKKGSFLPTIASPSLPPSESRSEEEEQAKEAQRKTELSRFLQYRARLEFAELMTRRQGVAEEEIEEEKALEREVGGGRRNVERFSGLGERRDLGGRGRGVGGEQKAGKAVGSSGGGGGGGDGCGKRERSYNFALSPPQLQPPPRSLAFCGGGVGSSGQGEMDGLRGRIRRLAGDISEVRKAVEEKEEGEAMARSSLFPEEKQGSGCMELDTYFPSSPISSSLYPAKERRKTGGRLETLNPE